jgi:hypothetical protein
MKTILIILITCILSNVAKADQWMYLNIDQARAATDYLRKEKQLILWCACCSDETSTMVDITSVNYYHVDGDFYFVVVEGTTSTGESVKQFVDLAYVHVNVHGKAKCLAQELKINCDPCTKPFKWGV